MPTTPDRRCTEQLRATLIAAAVDAYEQAGISGLCAEGRWECALGALRSVDLSAWSESGDQPPAA